MIGGLSSEMIPHLLQSFAMDGRFSLHVRLLAGENDHHRAEATFKALARALDDATRPDPRLPGEAPSTKGTIGATPGRPLPLGAGLPPLRCSARRISLPYLE